MQIWHEYCSEFDLDLAALRPGCEPLVGLHTKPSGSVVLIHGLSDSPHYMRAIGDHLYQKHNLNVYLPLLQAHGLKDPAGMQNVSLEAWKDNTSFAIHTASLSTPAAVSIGGLSTGGVLSFWASATDKRVNQNLLLFSAALDLLALGSSIFGAVAERLVRNRLLNRLLDWRQRNKPLIGIHPYRYAHVDYDGARELCRLLIQTDLLIQQIQSGEATVPATFVAHSYADSTADILGVKRLLSALGDSHPQQTLFFNAKDNISHANLVLRDPVTIGDEVIEPPNARFEDMMAHLDDFLSSSASH